jgi:hypothetical protein
VANKSFLFKGVSSLSTHRRENMNDILKAAFLFVAPEADPNTHRQWIKTPVVHLAVVGVKNYAQAVSTAKALLAEGITAIELCGGFGNKGVAMIADAVEGKIPVGVVRFDTHPGLGNVSGDSFFK